MNSIINDFEKSEKLIADTYTTQEIYALENAVCYG
jgi:hypothetical protein